MQGNENFLIEQNQVSLLELSDSSSGVSDLPS